MKSGPWWWRHYDRPGDVWESLHPLFRWLMVIGLVSWFAPPAVLTLVLFVKGSLR